MVSPLSTGKFRNLLRNTPPRTSGRRKMPSSITFNSFLGFRGMAFSLCLGEFSSIVLTH